jgi:hypothetical protein
MNRRWAFEGAPRCTARSKRSGQRCGAPAVRGWAVCRFHGAHGGAPCGEAHGRYRHGHETHAARAERQGLRDLLRAVAALGAALDGDG